MDWEDFYLGVAVLIGIAMVLAALVVPGFVVAEHNRAKVEHLTTVCVEHGFKGWDDVNRPAGCVR